MLGRKRKKRPRNEERFYRYSECCEAYIPDDVKQLFVDSMVRNLPQSLCQRHEFLVQAYLPIGLKTIGIYTFGECVRLRKISIPYTVEVIGFGAFRECKELIEVSLSKGLNIIGKYAFYQCRKLPKITVPSSVTVIEDSAFEGCHMLVEVKLQAELHTIKSNAFYCCSSLAGIKIPWTVREIEDYAFAQCDALCDVRISNGVESKVIGDSAFSGCTCLSRIAIPTSVESIGSSAFELCEDLVTVELHSKMTASFGQEVFNACYKLTNISIAGDSSISACCFNECEMLVDHYGDNIVQGLKNRFQDLPLHSLCYHSSSSTDADELAYELRELIASHDEDREFCLDTFGRSPLHILASSATKDSICLLEVLLDMYPPRILGWRDKYGKCAVEYLEHHDNNDKSWDAWYEMILQTWMIGPLFTWGREHWISKMGNIVQAALVDKEKLENAIIVFKNYEIIEAMALLELWPWRMQILVIRKQTFFSKQRVDRVKCRSLCGASFVIPVVMDFLGINRVYTSDTEYYDDD